MQYFALNQTFTLAINQYLNWMADSMIKLYKFGNTLDKILLCCGIPDVSQLQLFCADSYCLQYERIQRKHRDLDYMISKLESKDRRYIDHASQQLNLFLCVRGIYEVLLK
ncbi:Hypothetical_protein [Hexamita inflata]|uniref:Hypothetical_protein n=1 Tax=Hexamita inflata TaxID=28002 RepID=A0AA86V1R8_9EUKA|nr:Hypothetical protein HINF_LOCUS42537 [Hexamita inflata]CAI9954898.1 Hypothetical protein HINF_LOCUS42543 [Hexamita inflata]